MWLTVAILLMKFAYNDAYDVDKLINIAKAVYYDNFANTIVGDCDFNGKDPHVLCPRNMGNGCTMGQMFLGESIAQTEGPPINCKGSVMGRGIMPYKEVYQSVELAIQAERATGYAKMTNEGILEAGKLAVTKAQFAAKTPKGGQGYGVGVCTTLASAGQTLIGQKLKADTTEWGGAKIKHMREEYKKDGHEYLIITDKDDKQPVLVDYWYSALDGVPVVYPENKIPKKLAKRWKLNKAFVAKYDANKMEQIYVVPEGSGARYFGGDFYYGYNAYQDYEYDDMDEGL